MPSRKVLDVGKPLKVKMYDDSPLQSFVTTESWLFFKLLAIEPTFFQESKAMLLLRITRYFTSLEVVKDAAKSIAKF